MRKCVRNNRLSLEGNCKKETRKKKYNKTMESTSSIMDLPTEATAGGSIGGNVSMTISDVGAGAGAGASSAPMTLDQSTISQIVNGLQQASLAGATTLPSRDIPMSSEHIARDEQVQPNYVPPPETKDYISDYDDRHQYYQAEQRQNSLDNLYDEIQIPLLLAVLYFLFQLPFFKRNVFKYLPFLCHSDGNYNFNGLIFTCALYGLLYFLLMKMMAKFSRF